jgi:porphobilinogen deaminase
MLKIKWTDRITNEEVFQRVEEERLLLKILNNRCHSWIGHIIRHSEFVVNILEGTISGKKGRGKTPTTELKASRQEHRSGQLYSNGKNSLQQIEMESCQPIKRLKKEEEVYLCAAGCSISQKSIQIEENVGRWKN